METRCADPSVLLELAGKKHGVAADAAGLSSATPTEPVPVSSVPVSIPNATIVEHPGDTVTLFRVRAGWEWASIFVRPFGEGAEVAIHSSFGTFGYTWIAMGGDWREFLSSCSREYAMNKLAGRAYHVPLDREEFFAAMRAELDEFEKGVIEAWGLLDSDQDRRLKSCREALDDEWGWEDVPLEALFWHFNEQASGAPYAMELYETRMTKINPQVVGFWETIWTPFAEHLASVMSARSAKTEGLGPQDASATAESRDAQPSPASTPTLESI